VEEVADMVVSKTTTLTPTDHLATTEVEVVAAAEATEAVMEEATEAVAETGRRTTRTNSSRDVARASWEECKISKSEV
jgi:hypothetical protein